MNELATILDAIDAARGRGALGVLATVVRTAGSTYRRAGARMFVSLDGETVGAISGGCLESLVRRRAAWWTRGGAPSMARFDTTSNDDAAAEFGLGCRGVVDVLLERIDPVASSPHVAWLRATLAGERPAVMSTVIGGEAAAIGDRLWCNDGGVSGPLAALSDDMIEAAQAALQQDRSGWSAHTLAGGCVELFHELLAPPLPLLIFGAGHDIAPLAALGAQLGWGVTVVATRRPIAANLAALRSIRPSALSIEDAIALPIPPRSCAVVMTHHFADDARLLGRLLASDAAYVGQLGPASRTRALLEEIERCGFRPSATQLSRLHAPIGLDLGAETPAEIALAIAGEIVARRADRPAGFLSRREGPIHAAADCPPSVAPPRSEPSACPRT